MLRAARVTAALAVALAATGCSSGEPLEPKLRRLTDLPGDEVSPRFSGDGRLVAFVNDGEGQRQLMVLDVESGEIRRLAQGTRDAHDPSWAASDHRLAFTAPGTGGPRSVWVTDLDADEPVRISPKSADAFRPFWSPVEDLIAFTVDDDNGRQVWLAAPDGSSPRRLTRGPAHIGYGWSPDGAHVLTVSFATEAQDVWAWPAAGGEPLRLTDRTGEEWWPAWSPRGDRIAFYTTWDDEMTDIWTAEVGTGRLTRITDLPVEDFRPTWSPEGTTLAFSSDRASKSGLWLQRLGGHASPLALEGRAGGTPAWAPDGRSIVFSYLIGRARLFRVSRDGGEPTAITTGDRSVVEAVVSPDGSTVAFESEDVGSEADLFTLDPASGAIRRLTHETAYNARPSWSPDGLTLAFERSVGGGPRTTNVALMTLSAGEPRFLTDSGYARSPVWCGDRIVYTVEHSATHSGADQLWSVPAAGGEPRRLTATPGDKRSTDCTPGGKVAYHARIDGEWRVRSADLREDGGLSEPADYGPGEGARWSENATELAFLSSRNGQPDLFVASALDGLIRQITDSPLAESWPDWVAGTSDLVFGANPEGRDLWVVELDGS